MLNYEIMKYEGLDLHIWYVVYALLNGSRTNEITRTRDLSYALKALEMVLR